MNRLCTSLLGLTAISAAVFSANAADTYGGLRDGPAYASAAWSGVYAGVNGGYGWTANGGIDASGGFGGGQIGYNFFPFPHFLLGFEGDGDWADLTNNTTSCRDAFHCSNTDRKDNWFATARVRMGYVQDDWLFYGTGGFAWVGTKATRTIVVEPPATSFLVGQSASVSNTRTGWTLGGGVEYGFWRNWSVNVEYRYMQFNYNDNFFFSIPTAGRQINAQQNVNTVRVGLNYHFN